MPTSIPPPEVSHLGKVVTVQITGRITEISEWPGGKIRLKIEDQENQATLMCFADQLEKVGGGK